MLAHFLRTGSLTLDPNAVVVKPLTEEKPLTEKKGSGEEKSLCKEKRTRGKKARTDGKPTKSDINKAKSAEINKMLEDIQPGLSSVYSSLEKKVYLKVFYGHTVKAKNSVRKPSVKKSLIALEKKRNSNGTFF